MTCCQTGWSVVEIAVNEKQKLIVSFALECLVIVSFFLTMAIHFPMLMASILLWSWLLYSKFFLRKEFKPKKPERELTTVEVIAWFSIGISAICIFGFVIAKGLLNNMVFIIPMWIIISAISLLDFSKKLAALNSSKPASN
jgi:hypothetical protein